jgi:pilus assembly protein Flp/PilA
MNNIRQMLGRLNSDKRAVTALEYGMIAALISVVAITASLTIGGNVSTMFGKVGTATTSAATSNQ